MTMVMAKKTHPMENRTILHYVFSIFLVFWGCKGSDKSPLSTENLKITKLEQPFIPETTINGILALDDYASSQKFYPSINELKAVKFIRESPVMPFSNSSKTEYLLAYQYEGGTSNTFGCFEIGNYDSKISGYTTLSVTNFKTENGLHLGMTLNELEHIKGTTFQKYQNKIVYRIEGKNSAFLQMHNMPEYFLECELKSEKITKIKFGFTQP